MFLAKRIIEYLLTDSTLLSLLDNEKNVFPEFAPVRKDIYITVSTNLGRDLDVPPVDKDTIRVIVNVSRKKENAFKLVHDIVERVDNLLNKQELSLSNDDYKVLYFVRRDSTGIQIDSDEDVYWYGLEYEYILVNE